MGNNLQVVLLFLTCFDSLKRELVKGVLTKTAELSPSTQVSCADLTLTRILKDDTPAGITLTVAKRVGGVWIPEGDYTSRVENSPSGVFLKDLNYNDNGHYEFSCGGFVVDYPIQLEVDITNNLPVFEGGRVTLPCYSVTLGENLKSVLWRKNNTTVLKVYFSDESKKEYGAGFEDRVSLSPDWKTKGDLSLELDSVLLKDQGYYFCSVEKNGKKERGDPVAVVLVVTMGLTPTSPPVSTNCSATSQDQKSESTPLLWILIPVGVGVMLIVCNLLGWFCFLSKHQYQQGRETPEGTQLRPVPPRMNGEML